jgi:hypothetical protein
MKERPILFQGAMVRALLAGTKTQTRRLVKVRHPKGSTEPSQPKGDFWKATLFASGLLQWVADLVPPSSWPRQPVTCPYGQPGDRLWVREAFMYEPADYCWEASVSIPSRPASTVYRADFPNSQAGEGWKPSIHMPRKLCRLVLEVTEVRVERLQSISEADALAEGIERIPYTGPNAGPLKFSVRDSFGSANFPTAVEAYSYLWDSINGKTPGASWADNPWVWAVSFKRVTP